MACFRCGARQDDPARGPSPWKRGVLRGEQVLICPDCQRVPGWQADLDRCPACDGVRLSKALGIVRCSACGWSGAVGEPAEPVNAATSPPAGDDRLAADVRAALDRVLRSEAAD